MPKFKEITDRVLKLMEETGISGYRLCKECDIPEPSLSQIKKYKYGFTAEQLISISEFFKVNLDWLMKGIEPDKNSDKEKIAELQKSNLIYQSAIQKYDSEIMVLEKIRGMVNKEKKK